MRLTIFLILASCIQVSGHAFAQDITFSKQQASLEEVFRVIRKQTGFEFLYNSSSLKKAKRLDLKFSHTPLDNALQQMFQNQELTYTIIGKTIVVKEKTQLPSAVLEEAPVPITITGQVTDAATGEPLPSATILVKGDTIGTSTDQSGKFQLQVPEGAVLVVSYLSYDKVEVPVKGKRELFIRLTQAASGLDQLVVIGYGSQKKGELTGAVSTIKSNQFSNGSGSSNFADLIQGQAAGVNVQGTSGVPGAEAQITIRGHSSINAGVDPLWIIDGIPIITNSALDNEGTTDQSPMSLINPNDIESIEILKDAAATSIYGSRGSNGVIIVTTKTGKSGKASVNIDYSGGVSNLPFHKVEYMNTTQWLSIMDEAAKDNGQGSFQMTDHYSKVPYSTEFLTRDQAASTNTNWFDQLMRQGSHQNLALSVSGGANKVNYYISGNYRDDESVMKGNRLQRYTTRSNIDLRPLNNLAVGLKMNLSLTKNNRVKNSTDFESGNVSGTSGGFDFLNTNAIPWYPVHSLANPALYYNPQTGMNPAASIDPANLIDVVNMQRILGGLYAEYSFPFVQGLKLRTEVSLDLLQNSMNFWVSNVLRENGSYASDQNVNQQTLNYNLYGTYNRSFGLHSVNVVGGVEAQRSSGWNRQMQGQGLVGTYQELGTPNQRLYMSSGLFGENYLLAYFGRANYNYNGKYFAGFSLRYDGTSTFTPEYRWGTFAAFSAAWVISKEHFMDWVGPNTFLKIRGSFGQTGNQNIPSNLNVTGYSGNNPFGSPDLLSLNGTSITSIGVSNLTWETTDNADVGLDFQLLKNRINGSFDYYHKLVKGLLLQAPVPLSVGLVGSNSIWENIGDLLNSGYEFDITSTNITNRNFFWKTNFNISFNHNVVKKLLPSIDNSGKGMISGTEGQFITKTGSSINEFYLAKSAGVDPETGFRMVYVLDKDYYDQTGITRNMKDANGNDMTVIANSANIASNKFHIDGKNSLPKYYGGFSNTLNYKGIELSFQIIFQGGNYILDYVRRRNLQTNLVGMMEKDLIGNYWTKPGDKAKYPRLDWYGNINLPDGTVYSSFDSRTALDTWVYKGDFIKLKNITLAYNLPQPVCSKMKMQALRVFVTVDNLFTATSYPGWDPEGLGFVSSYNLPQLLTTSAGISIKF
ncbi:MAG TPA: TonB-dependent receptor [Puia sp.]|nr:TonB-dependent receptor [Puia sp.]